MDKYITWEKVSIIGELEIIKKSYFWIIFVPIVAKILSSVKSPLIISLGEESDLVLNIDLPFSWKLFYISAIFITISNIIYYLFCPRIIRQDKNYADFENAGKTINHVYKFASEISKELENENRDYYENIANYNMQKNIGLKEDIMVQDFEVNLKRFKDAEKGIYWSVREKADKYRPVFSRICFILYYTGILIFAIVAIQNICYIFNNFSF